MIRIEMLPEFGMIAAKYDPKKKPYFLYQLTQDLRTIATCTAGHVILEMIKMARPRFRSDFPPSINVMCVPVEVEGQDTVTFVQPGYAQIGDEKGNTTLMATGKPQVEGCPWRHKGGSCNIALNLKNAENGTGTVCTLEYTNAQVRTNLGETTYSFIVLAHELIHSQHCLWGIRKKTEGDEELCTTGLEPYEKESLTENKVREQLKVARRVRYF
jgi:hypothetical protein